MNWTRKHTLATGLALIAVTNAVALVGAAWNRSGEEARLALTQRELLKPYPWYGNRENSGISLMLSWRIAADGPGRVPSRYTRMGGEPAWLDRAKIKSLGFDVSYDLATERGRKLYEKQPPREALFVLELAGPAWERVVALARDELAAAEARLAASPAEKGVATSVKNARDNLESETKWANRLFVIDVGPDAEALRAKYADRGRYALVRGEVRPVSWGKSGGAAGYLTTLSVPSINVPFAYRGVFAGGAETDEYDESKRAPFNAQVAFGKRLEPWIVEAKK